MMKNWMKLILLSGLSICCLTGCASQTVQQETAVSEAPAQSQPEEAPVSEKTEISEEKTAPTDTDDTFSMYGDYDSFAEEFQKQNPEAYLYQIPEACAYKVLDVMVHGANYRIDFEDADKSTFFLEIDFKDSYPSIEDFYDEFTQSAAAGKNQLSLETGGYLFEDYANGGTVMYGITGEKNIVFALGGGKRREDAHEIFKQRYENLNL